MGCKLNDYWLCIVTALWTIFESVVHCYYVIYGKHKLDDCHDQPGSVPGENCANFQDLKASLIKNVTRIIYVTSIKGAEENTKDLTDDMVTMYIILDIAWIITSISLLFGVIMRLKELSAVVFYGPWIFVGGVTIIVDMIIAVYFALQIDEEENLPDRNVSLSAILSLISGRLGIFWVLNVVLLILVVRATYKAYKMKYSEEKRKADKESSEQRIRKWQDVYGTLQGRDVPSEMIYELTELDIIQLDEQEAMRRQDEDYSYTTFKCEPVEKNEETLNSQANLATSSSSQLDQLRGQLPWTYLPQRNEPQQRSPKKVNFNPWNDFRKKSSHEAESSGSWESQSDATERF